MLTLETEQEDDGRWIAEIRDLPGVLAYGATRSEAIVNAEILALRVLAIASIKVNLFPTSRGYLLRESMAIGKGLSRSLGTCRGTDGGSSGNPALTASFVGMAGRMSCSRSPMGKEPVPGCWHASLGKQACDLEDL